MQKFCGDPKNNDNCFKDVFFFYFIFDQNLDFLDEIFPFLGDQKFLRMSEWTFLTIFLYDFLTYFLF